MQGSEVNFFSVRQWCFKEFLASFLDNFLEARPSLH